MSIIVPNGIKLPQTIKNQADGSTNKPEKVHKLELSEFLVAPSTDYFELTRPMLEDHVNFVAFCQEWIFECHQADHAEYWYPDLFDINKKDDPDARFMRERLNKSILVDLGEPYGKMASFAHDAGASAYIYVDFSLHGKRYPQGDFSKNHTPEDQAIFGEKGMRVLSAHMDMLNFVSRLPDRSVNFSINGIDSFIIASERYNNNLMLEMMRAVKGDGIIFGFNSASLDMLSSHLENTDKRLSEWTFDRYHNDRNRTRKAFFTREPSPR